MFCTIKIFGCFYSDFNPKTPKANTKMFGENINNYHLKAVIKETKSSVVHLAQYKPTGLFLVIKRSKEQSPTEFQLTQV